MAPTTQPTATIAPSAPDSIQVWAHQVQQAHQGQVQAQVQGQQALRVVQVQV